MWRVLGSLILLFSVTGYAEICGTRFSETMKEYLAKCGGQAYSKCDDPNGMNQEALFRTAEAYAFAAQKKVFVIVGADWCPSCRTLDRDLKLNTSLSDRIEKDYVILKLNSDLTATRSLTKNLNWVTVGIPALGIYDPLEKKMKRTLYYGVQGTEGLVVELENFASGFSEEKQKQEAKIGEVRLSLLHTPIHKTERFGFNSFSANNGLQPGPKKDKFDRIMEQGVSYFHAFHYVNAARSFNEALTLEKNNVVALAFLTLSYFELASNKSDKTLVETAKSTAQALQDAIAISTQHVDNNDKLFATYAISSVCSRQLDLCGLSQLKEFSAREFEQGVVQFRTVSRLNYLSFFAYKSNSIAELESLAKTFPEHSGTQHYLTHLYESTNQMTAAKIAATKYATQAADSAHAQHMLGHILPQVGDWNGALKQFELAHQIHLRDFKVEGLKRKEEWHFPHNLDLLTATLLYLDRVDDIQKIIRGEGCTSDPGDYLTCAVFAGLALATGDFAKVDTFMAGPLKAFSNSAFGTGYRVLSALGRKDLAQAALLTDSMKKLGDYNSSNFFFARAAIEILNNADRAKENEIVEEIAKKLAEPGFDSWAPNVVDSRAFALVMSLHGKTELADKVKKMAIAAHETKICKTDACKAQ